MPRTKPSVRVHLSVAHHPKTAGLWATAQGRCVIVETLRLAAERFAGKRGNRIQLLPLDRLSIAVEHDLEAADAALRSVYSELGWGIREFQSGVRWEVSIRNFARKQGFHSEASDTIRGVSRTRNLASDSYSDSYSYSESDTGKKRSRKRSPSVSCPEELSPEQRTRIRAWAAAQTPPIRDGALGPAWERFRDWALSDDHKRRDWEATFRGALGKGWCLGGSVGPNGRPVSAAQARQDELHENAREAMRRAGVEDSDAFRLLEGGGT